MHHWRQCCGTGTPSSKSVVSTKGYIFPASCSCILEWQREGRTFMDNKCPFYHKPDVASGILENTLIWYVVCLRKVFTILLDSVMRRAIKTGGCLCYVVCLCKHINSLVPVIGGHCAPRNGDSCLESQVVTKSQFVFRSVILHKFASASCALFFEFLFAYSLRGFHPGRRFR